MLDYKHIHVPLRMEWIIIVMAYNLIVEKLGQTCIFQYSVILQSTFNSDEPQLKFLHLLFC